MSKNRVYAAVEIADQEVRLVVMEIYEARNNVLRVERIPCSGVQDQKIVDEAAVVTAVRQGTLCYRIDSHTSACRVQISGPRRNCLRKKLRQVLHMPIETV